MSVTPRVIDMTMTSFGRPVLRSKEMGHCKRSRCRSGGGDGVSGIAVARSVIDHEEEILSSRLSAAEQGEGHTDEGGEAGEREWCKLAYWELTTRVGRLFSVELPAVNVFTSLPHGDGL
ncbi:hypothetical protein C0J52_02813 [Blattella germanica]|nr:hypothetical protein C0J52_02813 [Blattella germanica]